MKSIYLVLVAVALSGLFVNCSGVSGSQSSGVTYNFFSFTPDGSNTMPVTTGCGYWNEPCVSVTVCMPGATDQCQTIPNVLIDTGSSGLRLFSSVVNLPLPQVTQGGGNLAECTNYADGTAQWGPVKSAAVVLGGELASNVRIQIVDRNFTGATGCASYNNLDYSPSDAGYNGILGVGLSAKDCGVYCNTHSTMYRSCGASSCTGITLDPMYQVSNPVASFTADNQGVIFDLPSVPVTGAVGATGTITFGIGSRVNNTIASEQTFSANSDGYASANFSGTTYSKAFLDSGSNAIYLTTNAITACTGSLTGFYCPASNTAETATFTGANSNTQTLNFSVGNASTLAANYDAGSYAFGNLAADLGTAQFFDLGYSYFLGRKIFVGMDTDATYTNGYWAFTP